MLYLTDFHHYLRVHIAVSSAVRRPERCFPDSVFFSTIPPCGLLSLFLCLPPSYAPDVLTWEHHNWFSFSRFLLHINQEGTVQLILWKKYRHQPFLSHRPSRDAEAEDTTRRGSCYTDGNRWLSKNCCRFLVVSVHLLHQGFIGPGTQSFNHRLCLCLCLCLRLCLRLCPDAAVTIVLVG